MKEASLPHRHNESTPEARKDYRAMLSYIRADKDTETFVADLRDNKTHLLSMVEEIRSDIKERIDDGTLFTHDDDIREYLSKRYVDIVLKQHVFDVDTYRRLPSADFASQMVNSIRDLREMEAFRTTNDFASRWLKEHPDSEAAKAVSTLGIYAPPEQHHKLLQELWPSYVAALPGLSEKKT
jgi:hypothetical protein